MYQRFDNALALNFKQILKFGKKRYCQQSVIQSELRHMNPVCAIMIAEYLIKWTRISATQSFFKTTPIQS